MNRNQQLAAVIGLACLTEHRTDAEQRALVAWAWDSDRHNTNTTTNRARLRPDWQPQNLVAQVDATRVLEDDDSRFRSRSDGRRRGTAGGKKGRRAMAMYEHSLRLSHRRRQVDHRMGAIPSDSTVDIDAMSIDLTEAWKELLSRLPNDVYGALKAAIDGISR